MKLVEEPEWVVKEDPYYGYYATLYVNGFPVIRTRYHKFFHELTEHVALIRRTAVRAPVAQQAPLYAVQ